MSSRSFLKLHVLVKAQKKTGNRFLISCLNMRLGSPEVTQFYVTAILLKSFCLKRLNFRFGTVALSMPYWRYMSADLCLFILVNL